MRVFTLAVAALSSTPLVAQSAVSASLVANVPTSVAWQVYPGMSGSNSHPAGPLVANGIVQVTSPYGSANVSWVVPTSIFIGCHLLSNQNPNYPSVSCSADWTLSIAAPSGTRGHVRIAMDCAGDFITFSDVRIDVHNDGTFEAASIWHMGGYSPWLDREWYVPVVLGATPLDVRILHGVNTFVAQGYSVSVEFVPWSQNAVNLGSTCGISEVGWIDTPVGVNSPYFLAALPIPGSGKDRLVARGYGTLAWLIVADDRRRLPVGTLGTQLGCDDMLATALVIVPGTWDFVMPPMPPGTRLFAQHASLGVAPSPPSVRFGVSNLVQLQY